MIPEIVNELIEIQNALEDWGERLISAIDSEASGARAERSMAKVRQCVESCRKAFAEIHREYKR